MVSASRLLRVHTPYNTFSHSVTMSVAISKIGCMQLICVKPGRKIDGDYHRDELLM